jgi:hypothetical protein
VYIVCLLDTIKLINIISVQFENSEKILLGAAGIFEKLQKISVHQEILFFTRGGQITAQTNFETQ